jgi:hypothetical protein
MKLAVLQMADEPQIVSTAAMLRVAGYDEIKVCGSKLREELLRAGCDTVLAVKSMQDMGYDPLDSRYGEATPDDMKRCDLFVEIKVRNVPKIVKRWPRLEGKIVWQRVNGAQAEICPKGGDEVHLPCPIITACLWYALDPTAMPDANVLYEGCPKLTSYPNAPKGPNWGGMAYTFWPPYPRSAEYDRIDRSKLTKYGPPFCIAHSARAWGYSQIIDQCVAMGVSIYGNNAPHGQISHRTVSRLTATGQSLVHLKSVDCPGWALYEAMLSGCPVVVGRLLNSRMLAYELLKDGETCYEFGVPASEEFGRGDMAFEKCVSDIELAVKRLHDPDANRRIGEAGRAKLNSIMWNESRDGQGFCEFMKKHFG